VGLYPTASLNALGALLERVQQNPAVGRTVSPFAGWWYQEKQSTVENYRVVITLDVQAVQERPARFVQATRLWHDAIRLISARSPDGRPDARSAARSSLGTRPTGEPSGPSPRRREGRGARADAGFLAVPTPAGGNPPGGRRSRGCGGGGSVRGGGRKTQLRRGRRRAEKTADACAAWPAVASGWDLKARLFSPGSAPTGCPSATRCRR